MAPVEINADLSHQHRLEVGILNHLASYCLYRREGRAELGVGPEACREPGHHDIVPLISSLMVPRGGSAGLRLPTPDIPPAISQIKISLKILLIIGLYCKYR